MEASESNIPCFQLAIQSKRGVHKTGFIVIFIKRATCGKEVKIWDVNDGKKLFLSIMLWFVRNWVKKLWVMDERKLL
jgi:hypothetical protein